MMGSPLFAVPRQARVVQSGRQYRFNGRGKPGLWTSNPEHCDSGGEGELKFGESNRCLGSLLLSIIICLTDTISLHLT